MDLGTDLGYALRLDAAPPVAWALWSDPEQLVRWMGKVATLDPRPGGVFRLEYGSGDVAAGTYVEVEPQRRLAFTWGWEGEPSFGPGTSTIELDFAASSNGAGTILQLRHVNVPADVRENVDEGWRYFLGRLVEAPAAT